MRVAVLFFGGGSRDRVLSVSRAIMASLEERNLQVDLIDGERDVNSRLTSHGYTIVITAATSFFGGKITPRISEFLKQAGQLGGKKACALVLTQPFGAAKALKRLMTALEHEGMFMHYSDTVSSDRDAPLVIRRLSLAP